MRLTRKLVCCLTVLAAVALMAPGAALASGSPSAGDQQYIDPLSNQNSPSSSSSSSPSTSATPAPTTSSSAPAPTAPAATTASSPPSAGSDPSSKTLPFTGFDAWAGAGLGLCLLGSGVYLRRVLARQ